MSEAAAAPAEAPAKKSNLLLIIIAAVIAAAAAGAGVYFMVGKKAATAEQADAAPAVEQKAPAQYVKFDPPFVVNFEARGMMRFLQVSVEVMTRDPATADMIKQHEPLVRNDLLMLLGSQTYETISTREGKEKIRQDALAAVANVITSEGGDGSKVEQLYFTSFVMQ